MQKLSSWKDFSSNPDFSIYNIPFGIYSDNKTQHHICSAIGDEIIDISVLADNSFFNNILNETELSVFKNRYLNDFIALGKAKTTAVRLRIIELLSSSCKDLQNRTDLHALVFKKQSKIIMLHPLHIGDYTDFYSSIHHATNVGIMFRDPNNALLPNWKHLPVGYHGRSSSIFVSPHSFYRPSGQTKPADSENPIFGPCKLLDFELETAFVVGKPTKQGDIVPINQVSDYIFGMLLFNDWSARDIQTWEYQPLGPFLAKNFASTISPWVITLEALEPFKCEAMQQIPLPLPYLQQMPLFNYDIELFVYIKTKDGSETLVAQSNTKYLYWTIQQQLAHHTINGCPINIGDLMASGTISGKEQNQFGSMLELTWRGTKPIKLTNGEERKFINDGDSVIVRGKAQKGDVTIGFGICEATVLPSKQTY